MISVTYIHQDGVPSRKKPVQEPFVDMWQGFHLHILAAATVVALGDGAEIHFWGISLSHEQIRVLSHHNTVHGTLTGLSPRRGGGVRLGCIDALDEECYPGPSPACVSEVWGANETTYLLALFTGLRRPLWRRSGRLNKLYVSWLAWYEL